ncbi:MAG: tetratricopeptide repeat protein [Planctomycetes bacterium]|nr:tetratricopeptide repeat protein [Planctomycetota bacterium]MCB9887378.1 tetratricopeptide repeat protein [Planctomycetota bacterium]
MISSRFLCSFLVTAVAGFAVPAVAQDGEDVYELMLHDGQRKLQRGQWSSAQADFEELLAAFAEEAPPDRPKAWIVLEARLGIGQMDLGRGEYEQVRDAIKALPAADQKHPQAVLLLGESQRRLGEYDASLATLRAGLADRPADARLRYEVGDVLWRDGKRTQARQAWQQLADDDGPGDAKGGPAAMPTWRAAALFRLGGRDNLERASALCVDAMAKEPDAPMARIVYGRIKFAAYGEAAGFPSGEKDLKKVLDTNGDVEAALLAMYELRSSNMQLDGGKTEAFLDRVLERNPNCVDAIVERAGNVLDDRRFHEAARMFDSALAIDGNDKIALAHRAAAAFLVGKKDEYAEFRARAMAGDPGWPVPDRILADHLVALYRFADALPFYESALQADGEDVATLHGKAKALIYTGRGAAAKELLERAKALQPGYVQPWRNNQLAVQELLDTEYTTVSNEHFRLQLQKDDVEVLQTYLMPVLLEATEVLGAKYSYLPDEAVQVETLHTWDDFSVRTIGFRGFTALGACFGKLITLVSPRDGDLRKQDFMWEATAWHEYTHVLTLGLSRHRVPRWLTEGFSVYEEKQRSAAWERGMDRELFDAMANQDIPPVRLLNRLFRGPRILFGYYQGGLIVELIAKNYGFDKAIELLKAYGDDLDTEDAFQRALGTSSAAFDKELLDYVRREKLRGMRLVPRYDAGAYRRLLGRAAQDQNNLQVRVDLAWACLQQDNPVDAGRWLAEVLRAEPEHGQAMLVRAELFRRRKELDSAIEFWNKGFAAGADDFDSRIACGDALLEKGDAAGAKDMWQRAKACWPTCTEQATAPELRLARLYRDEGERTQAQMEMKAYCRRTARAFTPRYTLAEFERESDNRRGELQYLIECNQIDPFFRELHVRMGEAYEALGKKVEAAREFEVAAAVLPALDRKYTRGGAEAPSADAPEQLEERGGLWLRAARLRADLGDMAKARQLVNRVLEQARGTDAAGYAATLQEEWRGR